ncbi:hypothetical protein ACEUA0_20965, partial [Aeromonas veronii]
DSQAVRSLSAGMAEGRGQCLHRENRLPAPGRVVVNILPVNGYPYLAFVIAPPDKRSFLSQQEQKEALFPKSIQLEWNQLRAL